MLLGLLDIEGKTHIWRGEWERFTGASGTQGDWMERKCITQICAHAPVSFLVHCSWVSTTDILILSVRWSLWFYKIRVGLGPNVYMSLHSMEEFSIQFCICVCSCVEDCMYQWPRQLEGTFEDINNIYSKMRCHTLKTTPNFSGSFEAQLCLRWPRGLMLGLTLLRWGNGVKRREVTRPPPSSHCGETFTVLMTQKHELHSRGLEHILFSRRFSFFSVQMFSWTSVKIQQFFICVHFLCSLSLFLHLLAILPQLRFLHNSAVCVLSWCREYN